MKINCAVCQKSMFFKYANCICAYCGGYIAFIESDNCYKCCTVITTSYRYECTDCKYNCWCASDFSMEAENIAVEDYKIENNFSLNYHTISKLNNIIYKQKEPFNLANLKCPKRIKNYIILI